MSFSKVSLEVSLIEISAMFQSRKSLTYGLQIGIGLALGGSTLLATFPALATPDPIFEPMLEEISAAAVASNPIRLPASVPTDVALYPSVIQNFGMLILRLDTTPDCEASACLGMGIAIAAAPPYWPPEDEELTAVDLGNDIQGYANVSDGFGSIQWIQDRTIYALSYQVNVFSSVEAIAMATSMVNDPPIPHVP